MALAVPDGPAQAETANVNIINMTFSPQTVQVGATAGEPGFPDLHAHVNWVMSDSATEHTVTFDDPRLGSSGRLATGQAHNVVFPDPGTFAYRCTIHPAMTGTVVITAAATAAGGGGSGNNVTLIVGATLLVGGLCVGAVLLRRRAHRRREPVQGMP
jgi:plastocyanin